MSATVSSASISRGAIESACKNAELNNISNVEFREANVFDALREMETAGERFDTIVLDPPAFAKNRASVNAAARGYKEINLRAIKLLNPGGILVSCTCSYHMPEDLFLGIIADAGKDAHRQLQLVEKRTQSSDHPILLGVPETYYLKCVIARVLTEANQREVLPHSGVVAIRNSDLFMVPIDTEISGGTRSWPEVVQPVEHFSSQQMMAASTGVEVCCAQFRNSFASPAYRSHEVVTEIGKLRPKVLIEVEPQALIPQGETRLVRFYYRWRSRDESRRFCSPS